MESLSYFLYANKCGIALFPAEVDSSDTSKSVKIDHFAFNVSKDNFQKAKKKYERLGLDFSVKDHHYFHSMYTKDPDGHIVELTTIVVDEEAFYEK